MVLETEPRALCVPASALPLGSVHQPEHQVPKMTSHQVVRHLACEIGNAELEIPAFETHPHSLPPALLPPRLEIRC